MEGSLCSWSLIGLACPHANEDAKTLHFDWSKRHCPDWSDQSHSVLWKLSPIGWGKPQCYWLK